MGSSATIIGGEYLVLGKIGEGSFGEVFRATHVATGVDYAIKREPINVAHPQLEHEAKIYAKLEGGDGIPHLHWFGNEGMYNAMVVDLLGPNLKQVRRENEKFPLSFVIELGVQIISQLEFIHKRGIVYRDIKPENFLLDADIDLPEPPLGKANTPPTYPDQTMSFFNDTRQRQNSIESNMSTSPSSPIINYGKPHLSIVDFGLAAFYRDPNGKHIPNKGSTPHKVGTARYASINIHCGRQHTRRDDIESVGYMLIEFLIGTLPWSGIIARNSRQGWSKMKEIKEEIELDELCEGLPKGFMTYIGYARSLKFEEQPDYEFLRNILRDSAGRGSEAQTVRCHREPVSNMSKSLEQCFDGLHIHRAQESMRAKVNCKPEDPLKNWRNRPQYVPPDQDEYPEYNPNSMWTTTPPDPSGMAAMGPQDIHQEFKDKIEWGPSPGSPQSLESDQTFGMFGDHRDMGRHRKPSWGEDDPNARWGQEDDGESNSGGDILPPFHIGSFQDEITPVPSNGKPAKGRPSVSSQHQAQPLGRHHTPQDARFYYSDEPPFGMLPSSGARSGQSQPSASQPIPSGNRKHPGQQFINTDPPHPLIKDPTSGSPKSLSSSLSSLSIRSGAEEEPGIERSQASANRGYTPELHSPEKPAGRKYQGPQERAHGSVDRQETGWGPPPHDPLAAMVAMLVMLGVILVMDLAKEPTTRTTTATMAEAEARTGSTDATMVVDSRIDGGLIVASRRAQSNLQPISPTFTSSSNTSSNISNNTMARLDILTSATTITMPDRTLRRVSELISRRPRPLSKDFTSQSIRLIKAMFKGRDKGLVRARVKARGRGIMTRTIHRV
ncbi:hypothetical protein BGX29_008981 [Mortierella sp. GBA35]|nr:hypothetical protein BGX29_008981 [Mortierella sp. GBA35]